MKIVELENKVLAGGGGGGSDAYLESRIHDKVREAIENSALGGPQKIQEINSLGSTSIQAYYQRTLNLMQD